MASRFSVQGRFSLVDRVSGPLRRIGGRFNRFTSSAQRGMRDLGAMMSRFRTGFLAVGAAVTAAGAAAAAGLRDITEVGADFDRTLAAAGARFTEPIARGTQAFEDMERAAMQTGAATEFTSSQAGESLRSLASAGFTAQQAIAALPGVVDLATTAETELGEATSMAADALGQWGLMTDDAAQLATNLTRVNDVLATGARSANLSVTDLSEAFRDAAPSARAAGASLEATTAMLDRLAANGLRGAQAGTALRGVFTRLSTGPGRDALRRLRIPTEVNGELRDTVDVLSDLRERLSTMGSARRVRELNNVFGQRMKTAGGILLDEVDHVRELQGTLENAGGSAAEMAAMMRNTASGDMATFTSAVEGVKLEIWSVVRGPMRDIIQGITEWVRANQGLLRSGLQTTVTWLIENMPTILTWTGRVAVGIGVLIAAIGAIGASALAAAALLPAAIVGGIALLVGAYDWLRETGAEVADSVSAVFSSAMSRVQAVTTAATEIIVGAFVVISQAVGPLLWPVFDRVRAFAGRVQTAWAPIGAWFAELFGGVADTASDSWEFLLSAATSVYQRLVDIFTPIGAWFADLWASISESFESALGLVFEAISGVAESLQLTGRARLAGNDGTDAPTQVVSPQERVARSVSESTSTSVAEVRVRADEGTQATVTRRPRGNSTLRFQRTGGL